MPTSSDPLRYLVARVRFLPEDAAEIAEIVEVIYVGPDADQAAAAARDARAADPGAVVVGTVA